MQHANKSLRQRYDRLSASEQRALREDFNKKFTYESDTRFYRVINNPNSLRAIEAAYLAAYFKCTVPDILFINMTIEA